MPYKRKESNSTAKQPANDDFNHRPTLNLRILHGIQNRLKFQKYFKFFVTTAKLLTHNKPVDGDQDKAKDGNCAERQKH